MERFRSNRMRAPIGAVLLTMTLAGCGGDSEDAASTAPIAPARGGAVMLSLTPPTQTIDGTPLWSGFAGYRVYWGTSIGQYSHSANIDNPGVATYVVENLPSATWYFVATVVTRDGAESDFSDPVSVVL
jgi:hypothetical protein